METALSESRKELQALEQKNKVFFIERCFISWISFSQHFFAYYCINVYSSEGCGLVIRW